MFSNQVIAMSASKPSLSTRERAIPYAARGALGGASIEHYLHAASALERDHMVREGFDPLPTTPAQARTRLQAELGQWAKLIKERGITAE